jgi:hypothetical protein
MVDDWLTHRDHGHSVLMLATERVTVAGLNRLARAHLVARGNITRRSRTYRTPDDHRRITLAVGDEVILRRNQRLTQPDGTTIAVHNGMTGHVTATRRRHVTITIELEPLHRMHAGPKPVTLPASYVGAHIDHGYARTFDTAPPSTTASSRPLRRPRPSGRTSPSPAGDSPTASMPPMTAPGSTPSADAAATRSPSIKRPTSTGSCDRSFDSAARSARTTITSRLRSGCSWPSTAPDGRRPVLGAPLHEGGSAARPAVTAGRAGPGRRR